MKKSFLYLSAALFLTSCSSQPSEEPIHQHESKYMNAKETPLFEVANGAKVNAETKKYWELPAESPQRVSFDGNKIYTVSDGLWSIASESIVNMQIIEGPEGLIIFDTGDNTHDAENFYAQLRTVTQTPIRAIIYSHSHYALGTQYILDQEAKRGNTKKIQIIGHHKQNYEVATTSGLAAIHPEVSGVLMARSIEQFNLYLPEEGADSRFKNTILPGEGKYVPIDTPVKNGQKLKVAGLDVVFYTDGIQTDTENQVLAYFPERGVVFNNVIWGWFPNIYSIRGGRYRNPEGWIGAVDFIQSLNPNYVLSTHSVPMKSKEQVSKSLQDYKDGLAFVLDQTLKGIMLGLNPQELQYFVKLPEHLANAPLLVQNYGEVSNMVGRIYVANFGQFDRNAAHINTLHPDEEASRMVIAMGGDAATYEKAQKAYQDGDYIWATQLADYLVKNQASDKNKQLKADCLRQMAYLSTSTNNRSWYLSQARELEGKTSIITAVPASRNAIVENLYEYVKYYRIRINPERSENTNKVLVLDFGKEQYGLQVNRGIAYPIQEVKGLNPDYKISMQPETWALIYNDMKSVNELLQAGAIKVEKGSNEGVLNFFSQFDMLFDWANDPALQMAKALLSK